MDEYNFESDFEDLLEGAEAEDFGEDGSWEFDEARRRGARNRAPLRTPQRGNAVVRPAPGGYATKAELAATAKRLDDRIATNSAAVKALDGRTRTMESQSASMSAALKKEIAIRKKTLGELRRSLDETRQISMLMPLLSSPGTVTIGGTTVPVNEGDTFTKLLPILLFSGTSSSSGSSGSGGGLFGGDSSGMTAAVLAIALSGRP